MRYSFVVEMLTLLTRLPGFMWCYFVHSWRQWVDEYHTCQHTCWRFKCKRCGRHWHDDSVSIGY